MSFWLWLFFSFRGRIGRGLFWTATLASLCVLLPFELLRGGEEANCAASTTISSAIYIALVIVVNISNASVAAKRFHDRGKTAWLLLIPTFILAIDNWLANLLDATVAGAAEAEQKHEAFQGYGLLIALFGAALIMFAVLIWLLIDLGIMRGDEGANRYGPPPAESPRSLLRP